MIIRFVVVRCACLGGMYVAATGERVRACLYQMSGNEQNVEYPWFRDNILYITDTFKTIPVGFRSHSGYDWRNYLDILKKVEIPTHRGHFVFFGV